MNVSESDAEERHVTVVPSILETTMSARKALVMSYNVPAKPDIYSLDLVSTLSFNICLRIISSRRHDLGGRERWRGRV